MNRDVPAATLHWLARLFGEPRHDPERLAQMVDRASRGMYLVLVVSNFVVTLGPLLTMLTTHSTLDKVASVLLIAVQLLVFTVTLNAREGTRCAVCVLIVTTVALTLFGLGSHTADPDLDRLLRGTMMTSASFVVLVVRPLWKRLVFATPIIVLSLWVQFDNWRSLPYELSHLGGGVIELVALLITAVTIRDGLMRAAQRSDLRREQAQAAALQEAAALSRHHELREIERLLHDEVLHALRGVIQTPAGEGLGTAQATTCGRAADLLDRHSTDQPVDDANDLTRALRAVIAESPLDVTQRLDQIRAPENVTVAIARAVGEALRNVERHAGVWSAVVTGAVAPDGVITIDIVDRGRGFVTTPRASRSWGLQRSVRERLTDVGGHVEVRSQPGAGTTVSLRWDARDIVPDTYVARVNLGQVVSNAILPFVLAPVPLALLMARWTPHPVMGITLSVLETVVGLLAILELRRGNGMSRSMAWVAAVLAHAAMLVAILVLTQPEHPSSGMAWLAAGANALVMLVIVGRPISDGVSSGVCLVTVSVLFFVARFGGPLAVATFADTWSSHIVAIFGALVLRLSMDKLTARFLRSSMDTWSSDLRRVQVQARNRTVHEGLTRIHATVGGFLRVCVAAAVIDDNARRTARALEAEVRDELTFAGLGAGIRQALFTLRIANWAVDLRLSQDDLPEHEVSLVALLGALQTVGGSGYRTTISIRDARVQAVITNPDAVLRNVIGTGLGAGTTIISDPDFIRISTAAARSVA